MRRILLITGFCIAGLMVAPQPGMALDRGMNLREPASLDVSAAKKIKHHWTRVHVRKVAPVAYVARRGWMDPSLGPDGRPYPNPYPPGTCSIDLGYGRFSTCDFHE